MSDVFRSIGEITPQRIWDGVSARPVHGDQMTVAVIELDADCLVPEHSHPNEQVGLMVEGSSTIRVGDEQREVGVGGTWCIPGGVAHEFLAGPDGALIFECFAPPRAEWPALPQLEQTPPRWPA